MAGCPNCGRRTLRTKDWVCQWCGYPLLYGSYKSIDKTYKELQEERDPSYRPEEPETEPEYESEPEPEPEPEPKPEPKWKLTRPPKPAYKPKPKPEPEPEPELEYELQEEIAPEPASQPAPRPVTQPMPQPATEPAPQPRLELAPQPQPELLPGSRTESVLLPEQEPAPEPAPQPAPASRPEPAHVSEIKPEPVTVPGLESIKDGTELTIDQMDALFRADSAGANATFKNKTLVLKGVVNKVFIRDHIDVRYIMLTSTRKVIWSVRCGFEKESVSQMSRLSEGQAIALRGKYDGYSKNIIFKDCELVR